MSSSRPVSRAMSFKLRLAVAALCAVGLPVFAGCGDSMASVAGKVTLNGEPLASSESVRGTVYFFPEGGAGTAAVGLLNREGKYSLSTGSRLGVNPGAYAVTISASELIPSKIPGEAPGGRAITPRRYSNPSQSGFRVEVAPGANEFDFALEADAKSARGRGR